MYTFLNRLKQYSWKIYLVIYTNPLHTNYIINPIFYVNSCWGNLENITLYSSLQNIFPYMEYSNTGNLYFFSEFTSTTKLLHISILPILLRPNNPEIIILKRFTCTLSNIPYLKSHCSIIEHKCIPI